MKATDTRRARYLAIAETLREEATRLPPGQQLPTQSQLRKRFRAGEETICSAIGELEKEGLVRKQAGRGVFVTALRPERAVAILTELDISRPGTSAFFLRLIHSLREFFADSGQQSRLYVGHRNPLEQTAPERISCEEFLRDAQAGRIKAAVTVCTNLNLLRKSLTASSFPIVSTDLSGGVGWVDYNDMVCQAVRYLVSNGRRRIALIGHRNFPCTSPAHGLDAFISCLHSLGLQPCDEWQQMVTGTHPGEMGADAFRRIWHAREIKPDGLVVLDDLCYYSLAPLLLYNRIEVPDHLMIVSHANKDNPWPMIPEPIRLEIDPDAFARAVGIELLRQLDLLSHTSENIPPILRLIEEATGSRGLAL